MKRKQSKQSRQSRYKTYDRIGCNYRCLFRGLDFNRIDIKLIDRNRHRRIILTDEIEPETGDNVEAEFFVDIASNWHTDYYDDMPPESRLFSFFASVRCRDNTLSHDEQSELEEQLEKHIYDRYDRYY